MKQLKLTLKLQKKVAWVWLESKSRDFCLQLLTFTSQEIQVKTELKLQKSDLVT